MRAEARKRRQSDDKARAARDKLLGTPAPPLPKEGWIGGPAMTWMGLKGKTVVLLFWSTSCVPCRG